MNSVKIMMAAVLLLFPGGLHAQPPQLKIQFGHTGPISAISASRDGRYILTASRDGSFRLWTAAGRELRTYRYFDDDRLQEGPTPATYAAFSPDGRTFVTGCITPYGRQEAILWDIAGNKKVVFDTGPVGQAVAYAPDGRYVAAGSMIGPAAVWSIDGRLHRTINHSGVSKCVFSPDGSLILITDMTGVYLINVDRDSPVLTLPPVPNPFPALAVGYRNDRLLVNDALYIGGDAKPLGKGVSCGFFTSDDRLVAGGKNGMARIYDNNGKLQAEFDAGQEITAVAPSADGRLILAGHPDGSVSMWTFKGNRVNALEGRVSKINAVDVAEGGKILFGSDDGTAKLWDLSNNRIISVVHGGGVNAVKFSPTDAAFVTGGADNVARLWSREGVLENEYVGHTSDKAFIQLSDVGITDVEISPDGAYVLTASQDKTAIFWDRLKTGNNKAYVIPGKADGAQINALAWSPDGSRLVAVRFGNSEGVHLYGREQGKSLPVKWMKRLDAEFVKDVVFSPTDRIFATAGQAGELDLWDYDGARLHRFSFPNAVCAAFSADGALLAAGAASGTGGVWDVRQRRKRCDMKGHEGKISSLAFSPDGRYLVTAGHDGALRLWDPRRGAEKALLIPAKGASDDFVMVLPDGYFAGTRRGAEGVHYLFNDKVYVFRQFDVQYNRPHRVLQTLGYAAPEFVSALEKAYEKRIDKMGVSFNAAAGMNFDGLPVLEILNRADVKSVVYDGDMRLNVRAGGKGVPLQKLDVFINNAPVFGAKGIPLNGASDIEKEMTLALSSGMNIVEAAVMNEQGQSSAREALYVFFENPSPRKTLYIASFGVNEYQDEGVPDLELARKDAGDMARLFEKIGEKDGVETYELFDEDVTKARVLQMRDRLMRTGVDDVVVVFFSGHGFRDQQSKNFYLGVSDIRLDDLADTGLPYEALENMMDGIPARNRLMLIDACNSGELDKASVAEAEKSSIVQRTSRRKFKGAAYDMALTSDAFALMKALFNDLRTESGVTVISAAGGLQNAQERGDWGNGAFTYCVRKGVEEKAADMNKDGRIMLSELKAYVQKEVQRLTDGAQKPTSRKGDIVHDFRIWSP